MKVSSLEGVKNKFSLEIKNSSCRQSKSLGAVAGFFAGLNILREIIAKKVQDDFF
jgi:hypothetical protein